MKQSRLLLPCLAFMGFLCLPVAAQAPNVPAPEGKGQNASHFSMMDRLFERLASAPNAGEAKIIAERIERRWVRSGSDTADLLSKRAAAAVAGGDLALAAELVDRMIGLKPDWAEAYFQRAVVFVLLDDQRQAANDLGQTLRLEPRHYKAMLALAAIMQKQGRKKPAFELYQHVLGLYPFNETARQLADGLRADVQGQDL
jgi:tetratricopeptide (TPR) repeat protein